MRQGAPSLNKPLQPVLSEFVRRTRISLPRFVELIRGQTTEDHRPNKSLIPEVLRSACHGYQHLDALVEIAKSGARVPLLSPAPPQPSYPANHKSTDDRYAVLVTNIRKEQDKWRCIVVDLVILEIWQVVHISPFGVVDKVDGDPRISGRIIHDLSFPVGQSINDMTDTAAICTPSFEYCDAISADPEFRQQHEFPGAEAQLQAGGVASAFRNICTHSESAHLFGGRLERDNALIIDTAAAFGWSANQCNPDGAFNYYWVDDHINVAVDIGSNCSDVEQSLRHAMISALGHEAINEKKFTQWNCRRKVLGLLFDTEAGTVAMPAPKIQKAKAAIASTMAAQSLSRAEYRSLLGRLRHVATCVRPARPFLQRLRQHERQLHRWQRVPVTTDMRHDLIWWSLILSSPHLNGVPLNHFRAHPPPDTTVEMDASDSGLCALVPSARTVLSYSFSERESGLVEATKTDPTVGFDINYRELLSCAFAVHMWGIAWARLSQTRSNGVLHIQFRIDNTSAVAWQNKMSSCNIMAQTIIRLLGYWESEYNIRFSSTHVAGVDNTIADAGSRMFRSATSSALFTQLTRGWRQVSPSTDIAGLEATWHSISAPILLLHKHTANTSEL